MTALTLNNEIVLHGTSVALMFIGIDWVKVRSMALAGLVFAFLQEHFLRNTITLCSRFGGVCESAFR